MKFSGYEDLYKRSNVTNFGDATLRDFPKRAIIKIFNHSSWKIKFPE